MKSVRPEGRKDCLTVVMRSACLFSSPGSTHYWHHGQCRMTCWRMCLAIVFSHGSLGVCWGGCRSPLVNNPVGTAKPLPLRHCYTLHVAAMGCSSPPNPPKNKNKVGFNVKQIQQLLLQTQFGQTKWLNLSLISVRLCLCLHPDWETPAGQHGEQRLAGRGPVWKPADRSHRRRRTRGVRRGPSSVGLQDPVRVGPGGIQRRPGQRLEVSVPLPPERRRWASLRQFAAVLILFFCEIIHSSCLPRGLHAAVCFPPAHCGGSALLHGAGGRAEHSPGQHRRLEAHLAQASWHRLFQLPGEGFGSGLDRNLPMETFESHSEEAVNKIPQIALRKNSLTLVCLLRFRGLVGSFRSTVVSMGMWTPPPTVKRFQNTQMTSVVSLKNHRAHCLFYHVSVKTCHFERWQPSPMLRKHRVAL